MNDKIKVLWVTNALGCGGAERQMLYMYDILPKYSNVDITILYYAKAGDALKIDGVKTVFVDKSKVGKLRAVREIAKYIRKENIQIMHAFGGSSANVYGRLGAMFTKAIPVGALLGKAQFSSFGMKAANSFLNLFGNWWTVNNNDLIPILKRDLKFVSMQKVRLIRNGFEPASCIDYHDGQETEFDIDKGGRFVFATVGRLHPVKNYSLFLKAAKVIAGESENVRFWVVGNGEEYDKLVSLAEKLGISEYVRFWGYRTDTDDIMYRLDAFVQTSFTEGSPNSIAEAMRAKKPVISTRSTDLTEMIEDGKNGYIVPSDDEAQLVEAMRKMLAKSAEERAEMGEYSGRLFTENFLGARAAKEFDTLYSELLSKN